MKVTVLAHTPDPEKVVAGAAKLCYSSANASELFEGLTDEKATKFLNMLVELGHGSPLEHVSFTFAIEGVSRALSHQLVRHRLASYSQKSQRYVNEENFDFITPEVVQGDKNLDMFYRDLMTKIQRYYSSLQNVLEEKYINEGVNPKEAEKKANEDARYILPNACCTQLVMTMNARELLHFFNERCCNRAQWEIRHLADAMLEECKTIAPVLFKYAGPSCRYGTCKEGKMTCGKPRK